MSSNLFAEVSRVPIITPHYFSKASVLSLIFPGEPGSFMIGMLVIIMVVICDGSLTTCTVIKLLENKLFCQTRINVIIQ